MPDKSRREQTAEDDGRTIAKMNVEGMPWFTPPGLDAGKRDRDGPEMSPQERRAYIWAAVRAGLLIFLVFALAFFLFLLFCTKIWFT